MEEIQVNKGKELIREVDGVNYMRIPLKTKVVGPEDTLEEVLEAYVKEYLKDGDVVFIAESIVAAMQERIFKMDEVEPRALARFLTRFIYKNPADPGDPGLAIPETMEVVISEVGTLRILLAVVASAVGKLFRKRGWFYRVAGPIARDIDGPTPYAIPPYNEYIVLSPSEPQKAAAQAQEYLKNDVAIVDINDLGGNILGNTSNVYSNNLLVKILKDNPLGQGSEQTPIGIIRKV